MKNRVKEGKKRQCRTVGNNTSIRKKEKRPINETGKKRVRKLTRKKKKKPVSGVKGRKFEGDWYVLRKINSKSKKCLLNVAN